MIRLIQGDVYLYDGILEQDGAQRPGCRVTRQEGIEHTIAWPILMAHNTSGDGEVLRLKMDSLTSHDITYVGIVQTARASGLTEFPLPYVLTNCHNSLCAVGGTLNEDDHVFGLSAAKKYGGIFVPPHQSVIHSYAREVSAASGGMIMGSDSHTRYGALGCMGIGEGGPELVKQLLGNTYDVPLPGIVGVYLTGSPVPGVGPQDVALAIIGAVYPNGFVKNKVMEFVGPGLQNLSVDFRNGIDVMTTETTCLSSVWATDDLVARYYTIHKRPQEYRPLAPGAVAVYDGMIVVDLSDIRPMIALPFHPSNVYSIEALNQNPGDILRETEKACQAQLDHPGLTIDLLSQLENGRIKASQGVIAGCSGGIYENILAAAAILDGKVVGSDFFSLSIYPASAPVNLALLENGTYTKLLKAGAIIRTAFCGPCFGAGDTPSHNGFSLRHSTRNFPNREGSRPNDGQIASVALMDARSIAATAVNGGYLTPATAVDMPAYATDYRYDDTPYRHSVVNCWKKADPSQELKLGPFIADWPGMLPLSDHLLLSVASVIRDPVTTTDELIPSGETSTYRSNPLKLAEFTLSRKDPGYVGRAKAVYEAELSRRESHRLSSELSSFLQEQGLSEGDTAYVSAIFANSPGDGSAREQAASCQRVLGGGANIAYQYATKRYRSNLVNWGILPFTVDGEEPFPFAVGDLLLIKNIRQLVESGAEVVPAVTPNGNMVTLYLRDLSAEERDILLWGSLINHYGKAL